MFQPYHPDHEVTIGDLTLHSSADSIALSGRAEWQRDQHSLRHLRALIQTLGEIEAELANTPNLPETAEAPTPAAPGTSVKNPFSS